MDGSSGGAQQALDRIDRRPTKIATHDCGPPSWIHDVQQYCMNCTHLPLLLLHRLLHASNISHLCWLLQKHCPPAPLLQIRVVLSLPEGGTSHMCVMCVCVWHFMEPNETSRSMHAWALFGHLNSISIPPPSRKYGNNMWILRLAWLVLLQVARGRLPASAMHAQKNGWLSRDLTDPLRAFLIERSLVEVAQRRRRSTLSRVSYSASYQSAREHQVF